MRRIFFLLILPIVVLSAQEMIVRVYAPTWHDMEKISEKYDFDVVGHYSRPDVFQLIVNERPAHPVTHTAEDQAD